MQCRDAIKVKVNEKDATMEKFTVRFRYNSVQFCSGKKKKAHWVGELLKS
jgi:hypothetical protein